MKCVMILLSVVLFASTACAMPSKLGYKTLVIQDISFDGAVIDDAPDGEMEQLQSTKDHMVKEYVQTIKEYVESKQLFEKVTTVATGAEDELVFQSRYNLIKVGIPMLRGFRFLTLIYIGGGFEMRISGRLVNSKGQVISTNEESENTGWYKGGTTSTLNKYNRDLAEKFGEWLESKAENGVPKW